MISDAAHMFVDSTALLLSLYATYASQHKPDALYNYGYARIGIVCAFINAILLLFIGFSVFTEAIDRLIRVEPVDTSHLLLVAIIGLILNLVGLYFFHDAHDSHHSHDDTTHHKEHKEHTEHKLKTH